MPNYFTRKIMKGSKLTIRNEDSPSTESSDPSVGSGQNFAQFRDVELSICITGGTNPEVEITPLYLHIDGAKYRRGTAQSFSGAGTNHFAQVAVNANTDFYLLLTSVTGSPTNVTIEGEGIN